MNNKIRIHIADDHPVVIEGLRAVLKRTAPDISVTGDAADGREALALARRSPADIYVYDISMPPPNGLEALAELLAADPEAKVIILSMHDDRSTVEKALRAGAMGYLVKESAAEEIVCALRSVSGGGRYLSPSLETVRPGALLKKKSLLTGKEREIVKQIAKGLGNKEIAVKLDISPNTVHVHRRNISTKLGIHKQTDLVRYAIREGLVKP
jgi:DNA-binding NarL/FixJ family response regulator